MFEKMFKSLSLATCVLLAFIASACGGTPNTEYPSIGDYPRPGDYPPPSDYPIPADYPLPVGYRLGDNRVYEGYIVTVFVLGVPSTMYWNSAGWEVSTDEIKAEDLTADCTLYPLANTVDQWTGMCAEPEVYVPALGVVSELISLALVAPDGGVLSVNIHGETIPVGE
ncbi:MAG TPA: hypothetical protein PKM21_15985 [Anaerolineales bacterium]|nr:hypothetical protein [Anaerolineales bacterium]